MTTPLDNTGSPSDADLTAFLESQEPSWLAEQLMIAADDDPVTRVRLAAASGSESAVGGSRDLLADAVEDYRPGAAADTDDGSDELRRVIDLLEDLLEYGFTDEAADLADEARELYLRLHGDDGSDHLDRLVELAEENEN